VKRRIFKFVLESFSDRAFTYYANLMTSILLIWFLIALFTNDLAHNAATFVVFLFTAGILRYLDLKFKNKQSFLYIFLEFTVYPAVLAFFFISLLVSNIYLKWIPEGLLNLLTIIFLLVSVSLISYFLVKSRKKDDLYLKMVRVVLDYAEVIYWVIFSVVLFLFVSDSSSNKTALMNTETSNMIKLFVLPFMIQTRLIKAYIGFLLQKLEFKKNRLNRSNFKKSFF